MEVYVLSKDGTPLMPTERCGWVAYALKHGEAKVVRREPFTIQLLRDSTHYLQAVTLGVDTGSRHIGLSASTEKKELYSAQVELRTDVSELLTARREFRKGRRGRKHNWYRPARWQNRANEKGNAALPPSVKHKADSHIRAIQKVCKFLPISKVCLEIGKFDSQKIANPDIQGEQYQQGTLAGWENLKAYAKYRDGYKCRACGKSKFKDGVRLEVHHIIRKADGGTDVPENVVTLCEDCHKTHHRGEKKLKLKRPPQHKGEAHMNAMRNRLMRECYNFGVIVRFTYGYKTAMVRREHGIEKSHAHDAFCIAGNYGAVRNNFNVYLNKFIRRHRRNLHAATIKSPQKLSAVTQKKLSPKMAKYGFRVSQKMTKRVKGFALYDSVDYKGERWVITSLRTDGNFKITRFSDGASAIVRYRHIANRSAALGWVVERVGLPLPKKKAC